MVKTISTFIWVHFFQDTFLCKKDREIWRNTNDMYNATSNYFVSQKAATFLPAKTIASGHEANTCVIQSAHHCQVWFEKPRINISKFWHRKSEWQRLLKVEGLCEGSRRLLNMRTIHRSKNSVKNKTVTRNITKYDENCWWEGKKRHPSKAELKKDDARACLIIKTTYPIPKKSRGNTSMWCGKVIHVHLRRVILCSEIKLKECWYIYHQI